MTAVGLKRKDTLCMHPGKLEVGFSSRIKSDPALRKAAALILPLVTEIQLYKISELK